MSSLSPASVLYNSDGYELAIVPESAVSSEDRALLVAGSDGSNKHILATDISGRTVVVGAGTAGSQTGGVVTVQGDPAGTPIPITGSITATNPSVGTNGSADPGSSTQIGGTDGTNLQPIRLFDLDSGAGAQYVLGVGLRKSANGGSVELGTSSDPIRIDPTGTTIQPVSGTVTANQGGSWTVSGTGDFTVVQSNPANLKATVTGAGSAGTPDTGVITIQGIASGTPITVTGSVKTDVSDTSDVTIVSSSTSSVQLLAANAARVSALFYNASTKKLWIKLGTAATSSSFTVELLPNSFWELPINYTGVIHGAWAAVNGDVKITELT